MASFSVSVCDFFYRFGLLIALSVLVATYLCAYLAYELYPSENAFYLASYVLPIASAIWVQRDARRRKCTPCYDFGTFVIFTWMFSVPAYMIWQYGWKGLAMTALFVGIWFVPTIAYIAFWMLKFGF